MSDLESVCLKQTQMPGSTALFTDYLYRFDRVRAFYQQPPDTNAIHEAARQASLPAQHRQDLVAALRQQNSGMGEATASNVELLSRSDTIVAATGQQVGLYTGPVFTLYKAITALEHARRLREAGQPAVAVFWLATEDHDLAEVDHAWVHDTNTLPARLQGKAPHSKNQPVGTVVLADTVLDELGAHLAELPFRSQALALAERAYPAGVSFRDGFRCLLNSLLRDAGLIFLDPMDPAIRRLAAPLFDGVLRQEPELNEALTERSQALVDAGYHAQVRVAPETSLLFRIEQDRRIALKRTPQGYQDEESTCSVDSMRETLAEAPQRFSPNALLRPVTQDFLLPTAVYIAGPSEIAYLAQAEVLYDRLLGRMPVVLPRVSLTVINAKAERLLKRYRLSPTDCLQTAEDLRRKIARRLVPAGLEQQMETGQSQIERALTEVHRELAAFDTTLGQALENTSKKMLYQFNKIRSKASQECLRRDARAQGDAAYLANLIYPERHPQERLYSALSFYARHGPDFVESVRRAVRPDCHDHQVLTL